MHVLDVGLGYALDDAPIKTVRPAQKDAIQQRMHARPQRVDVAECVKGEQCVDRVADPDAAVDANDDVAVRRNGAVQPTRIPAAFDLPQTLFDGHASLPGQSVAILGPAWR